MTIQTLFSVYDKKLEAYTAPFSAPNQAVVIREYGNQFKQGGDSPYVTNPDDFAIYAVGTFDDSLGILSTPADIGESNRLVAEFTDFVPKPIKQK